LAAASFSFAVYIKAFRNRETAVIVSEASTRFV
jgi:hypothetical protein